jgi:inhibitor of KinA
LKYKIFPLSDSALSIDFGNEINEEINDFVTQFCKICQEKSIEGIIEFVPAYSSISVFYNPFLIKKANKTTNSAYKFVEIWIEKLLKSFNFQTPKFQNSQTHTIPVIYDGEDLAFVAEFNNLTAEEVIKIHTKPLYRVYMMGFLPGFAYFGGMDSRISTPRKTSPRSIVKAGSVGIAGNQTGIYPLESPGGWQLIGTTDLELFTPNQASPTLLKVGDFIKFERQK